jgi:polyisoprenoid-binding protein YceI
MESKTFEIIAAQSNIDWIGRKVTGAHNGTIGIKEGFLTFSDDGPAGGRFVIDTTSIKILDVTDPAANAQFAGHLASADFFNSALYPEAILAITTAASAGNNTYHIDGDLTIKGITHPIRFDAQINDTGDTVSSFGKIIVDRTKFGMKFRSGSFFHNPGDTLIYNDFDLIINISAKAAAPVIS